VSSRKVELDEVIEPPLHDIASSIAPKIVPELTSPNEEGINDENHEVTNKDTTTPRSSSRTCTAPEWYGDPIMNVMLVENNDLVTYEEAMMNPDSNKWLEAMQSEIGSMYENKVWTLVDLPNDHKAIENKWIFKRKTDADGNVTVYKARLVAKGF
jgi:hypothetical protein